MLKPILSLAAISLVASPAIAQTPAQLYPADMVIRGFTNNSSVADVSMSRDIILEDFDGDGDLDMFVANLDQDNCMYLNDGSGSFSKLVGDPICSDSGNSRGLAVGDIDSDGDLDIFVANSAGQANFLYVNSGTNPPSFTRRTTGPVATDIANSRQAEFADVDNDGDLDLFVTNFNDTDNFLYLNRGNDQNGVEGLFARHFLGDAPNDGATSYGLTFGDIDEDGDLDLFVANHSGVVGANGARNYLYFNDGTGIFTLSVKGTGTADPRNSLSTKFVDIDGDGHLDLFVGNGQAQHNQIFLGDGTGEFDFRPESVLVQDRGKSIGVCWMDIEGDGDMDVIIANRSPDISSELYLNLGGGIFARQAFGPLADNREDTYDIAAGDIDGDGLVDLALANLGAVNQIMRNEGPQFGNLGQALQGGLGVPALGVTGNFLPEETVSFYTTQVPDGARTYMILGLADSSLPFLGGTLTVGAIIRVMPAENTGPDNFTRLNAVIPASGLASNVRLFFQTWIADPGAPFDYSSTNGLRVVTP